MLNRSTTVLEKMDFPELPVSKNIVKFIMDQPTRWVMISKRTPHYRMTDNAIFVLSALKNLGKNSKLHSANKLFLIKIIGYCIGQIGQIPFNRSSLLKRGHVQNRGLIVISDG